MPMALLKSPEFLSPDEYLAEHRSPNLFEFKEHDMVDKLEGRVLMEKMSANVARMYLCAVRNGCSPFKYSQQAVIPWAADGARLESTGVSSR